MQRLCHLIDPITCKMRSDGVIRLAMSGYQEPVNIGSLHTRTILEFAQAVLEAVGSESEVVHLPALVDDPRISTLGSEV